MRIYPLIIIGSLFLFLPSCDAKNDQISEHNPLPSKDTFELTYSNSNERLSKTVEYVEENTPRLLKERIEKKYGIQWDFCDCIKKNDSINKAIENSETLNDTEFIKLMARFDDIDGHCKSILSVDNRTPEARENHNKKVKRCQ